jgi:hypothetical protein
MRTAGVVALLVVLFLVLTATGVTQLGVSNRITIFSLQGSPHFNYIVTIILEKPGTSPTEPSVAVIARISRSSPTHTALLRITRTLGILVFPTTSL